MIDEIYFKISMIFCIIPFYIVRSYFSNKYIKSESIMSIYPLYIKLFFILAIFFMIFLPIIYIFTPFIDSFSISIPNEVRIFGILVFISVILLMWWILQTLKHNFDAFADNRFVVTSGPYKFVRHPMYLVFILQAIAQGLISSNLLIWIGVPIVILFKFIRVIFEDRMLVTEFDESYISYKSKVKALIPKIW